MWHDIHTTQYYSAIEKNDVLASAATWLNLEHMMLTERSQTQKTIYCMIPFSKCPELPNP